jgi:hypothetical protein
LPQVGSDRFSCNKFMPFLSVTLNFTQLAIGAVKRTTRDRSNWIDAERSPVSPRLNWSIDGTKNAHIYLLRNWDFRS